MKSRLTTYMVLVFLNVVSINVIAQTTTIAMSNTIGEVSYESKDHRSNVYEVVSDIKTINNNQFQGIVIAATDYYPYGSEVVSRSFDRESYNYGYQGSEKRNEISGKNNSYTTYYRDLDVRILRWTSGDPKNLAFESPYVSMSNNPIVFNDPLGDEVVYDKGMKGFFQKVKVKTNKMFSKSFREKFNELSDSDVKYRLRYNRNETALIDGGKVSEYSSDKLSDKYKENNKIWNYSNRGLSINMSKIEPAKYLRDFGKYTLNTVKIPLKLSLGITSGITIGAINIFKKENIGWGMANAAENFPWFGFGFGDYNKYNMFGMDLSKSPFGTKRLRPENSLLGVRLGIGKKLPIQFFEFGKSIDGGNNYDYHLHINLIKKKRRKRTRNVRGGIINFRN